MSLLNKTAVYRGAQYFGRAADVETLFDHVGATISALTPGSTVNIDASVYSVFSLTPGQSCNIAATTVGKGLMTLIVQATTSSRTLTFTTNFKTTGTLASGTDDTKKFVLTFIGDGTTYYEVSRTTAI